MLRGLAFLSLTLTLSLSACFKTPFNNKAAVSVENASSPYASVLEKSETKSTATLAADSKEPVKLAVSSDSKISGTSITVPPGTLQIATTIIIEEGSSLADTSLSSELSLTQDIQVTQSGQGVIIRPSEQASLNSQLEISLPIKLGSGLRLTESPNYAVFYKNQDPVSLQLISGMIPVDGINARINFDEDSGRDVVQLSGFFGIYWVVTLNRQVRTEEIPPPKVSQEPIINKNRSTVITTEGVVKEAEILVAQALPEMKWNVPVLSLDARSRKVSIQAEGEAGFKLSDCKADLYENSTDLKGLSLDTADKTSATLAVPKIAAHKVYGRFRCMDEHKRTSISPWSTALALEDYALTKVTELSLKGSASGIQTAGQTVDVALKFDRPVTVEGAPNLRLKLASGERSAAYASGSGSQELHFRLEVKSGDDSQDLSKALTAALEAESVSVLKDPLGANVAAALPQASNKGALLVDAVPPTKPLQVEFPSAFSTASSLTVSWQKSIDSNLKGYNLKICESSDCSTACAAASFFPASPAQRPAVNGKSYYACVQAEDLAGHSSVWASSASASTVDTTVPSVLSVSTTSASAFFPAGTQHGIDVQFSEPVFLSSNASLGLRMETGTTDRLASYQSGSGSSTLRFQYTALAGDNTQKFDVVSTNALELGSGATLRDIAGNAVLLAVPAPGSSGSIGGSKTIVIDSDSPASPATVTAAPVGVGQSKLNLTWPSSSDVNFKEYHAKLCPTASCDTGCLTTLTALTTSAQLSGTEGSSYFACVESEDKASNRSGFRASALTKIDSVAPTVISLSETSGASYLREGGTASIQVRFSEDLVLTNSNQLTLKLATGGSGRLAAFASHNGSDILFTYTVQAGDSAEDLDAFDLSALSLGTATIRDASGNSADLALPSGGLSLAGQAGIIVDTQAPSDPNGPTLPASSMSVTSIPVSFDSGSDTHMKQHQAKFCTDTICTANCSSVATGTSSPITVTAIEGITYRACVQAEDLAGNFSNWVSSAGTVIVDAGAPFVTQVTSSKANGQYKVGEVISIAVIFNEAVNVSNGNDINLLLETGATDRAVLYSSGTGTDTLLFAYTVQPGDTSSDLNYVSTASLTLGGTGAIRDVATNDAVTTLPSLAGPQSLASLKALVIDTTAPTAPSSVGFNVAATQFNFTVSYAQSSDTNFQTHEVKICGSNDCVSSCQTAIDDLASPLAMSAAEGSYFACVRGRDVAGNFSAFTASLSPVNVDNTVPTVNVGPDRTDRMPATLSASVSGATSLLWVKVSGPGALTFSSTTSANTTVTSSISGSYVLRLTATDAAGNSASDELTFINDVTAPSFQGAIDLYVSQDETQARMHWRPATDTVSGQGIVYRICVSQTAGSCVASFTPSVTVGPSVWEHVFTGLTPGVETEFLVRAEDGVGNRDSNTIVKSTRHLSGVSHVDLGWDPLESTCRHASLSIL